MTFLPRHPIRAFSLALVAALLGASDVPAATYELSAGFSPTSNPNGPWAYGWSGSVGGAFTVLTVPFVSTADGGETIPSWQLTTGNTPAVYKSPSSGTITVGNGIASFPANTVWFYPGDDGRPENFGVIRFTLPSGQAGNYLVQASASPVYPTAPQGDTDFHVVRNGIELFGQFLDPSASASFTSVVTLADGDTLEFAIGRGADGSAFGSGLRIAATLAATNSPPPPPPQPVSVFVLSDGFSSTSNPNPPWSYGWAVSVGGAFTPLGVPFVSFADGGVPVPSWQLTSSQTPAVYKNTSSSTITVGGGLASFPAETVWFYAGEDGRPENYGVIRFTVGLGQAGHYQIKTKVAPVYPSSPQGDTDFHLVCKGTEVFSRFLSPEDSAHDTTVVQLLEGDTVDFVIGRGADGSAFGSGLRIESTLKLLNSNGH
jgi:hypothetical protein